MAYSYTQPVRDALNGVRILANSATHTGRTPYLPGTSASSPKQTKVPDMRLRLSDLRQLQSFGLLPSPDAQSTPIPCVSGLNVKCVSQGKSSSWLLLGTAAEPTPHKSPAHDEDDEVNGQSPLRPTRSCHINPRALDLVRWLEADQDPRFWMTTSPAFQSRFNLPPLQGSLIVLGVRSNSKRFADGVQALVDKIKSIACDDIAVVMLDFPVPGGRVDPKGVSKRATGFGGAITVQQVEEARLKVYRLIAEIPTMLGNSGAKPHVSPIPGNLDGKDFVDFYTKWAQAVGDSALRARIVAKIQGYEDALAAYNRITIEQFGQFATTINARMRETAAGNEVTLVPVPDHMARSLQMGDKAHWIQLRERAQFEAGPR